ncbi:DUF922 domain-containing protein [uncultured Hoeflea sp.]|uniref:DUF922 domain-containing protein n=1 Tax=uncultured Hoeflea sp. TaxID=538666 RepID=UPI0030DBAE2F|tara:strand:- start:3277 stop:3906 length:630 start_codon:yes stop_codon:yes gene_type:complete
MVTTLAATAAPSGGSPGEREPDNRFTAMCRRLIWPLCLAVIMAGCTTGKPGRTDRYYSVYGETISGFAVSVRARAPRSGRAYGLVEITFHPDYTLEAEDKECRVKVRDVGLELVVTLPKWRDAKAVSGPVRHHWRRFERTIRQHEMTHIRIAETYAVKMHKAIAAQRAGRSCNDLARRIKRRINQIKIQHLRAHRRFDLREQKRLKRLL